MYTKCAIGVLIIAFAIKSVRLDDLTALQNEIMDSNYNGAVGSSGSGSNNGVDQMNYGGNRLEINNKNQNIENLAEPPRHTWLDSARNALSGPAGQIVVSMAKEMISRSTGNSQVSDACMNCRQQTKNTSFFLHIGQKDTRTTKIMRKK